MGEGGSLRHGLRVTHRRVSALQRLATVLGAELLRARLLGASLPVLAERYRIEKVLGRGATGVVVRAFDTRLAHNVALKIAPCASANESMLVEARALAHLRTYRYPSVVQVHEVGTGRIVGSADALDVDYVQMELIEGPSVRAWLLNAQPTQAAVLTVFAQIADGLRCVHHHGIAHGDVKPDNAIMRADGVPVLVDFAFALPVYGPRSEVSRGMALGTAPYMAPEVWKGRARRRSDVYALAVSFWEIWTGVLPFDGSGAPTRLFGGVAELRNEAVVPERLRAVLKQAMHPRPGARPTVDVLRNALMETVEAYRVTPRATPRWGRRLGLALVLLVLAAGWTFRERLRTRVLSRLTPPLGADLRLHEGARCRSRPVQEVHVDLRREDGVLRGQLTPDEPRVQGETAFVEVAWRWSATGRIASHVGPCHFVVDWPWRDLEHATVLVNDGDASTEAGVRVVSYTDGGL